MVHRSIDCSTWDDPWFADLPPKQKLLFLFLITNRRLTQCGAMEITVRQMSFETGLDVAEIPNLVTACRPCNRSKQAKLVGEWRP